MRDDDHGLINLLGEIAYRFPLFGISVGVASLLMGAYYQWIDVKGAGGLAPLVALMFWMVALLMLVATGVGFGNRWLKEQKKDDFYNSRKPKHQTMWDKKGRR